MYKLRSLPIRCLTKNIHTSKFLCEAEIIDGKSIASKVLEEVKVEVNKWISSGKRRPKLIAILVGNDPASTTYVGRKVKAAKSVGIDSETVSFDNSITEEALLSAVENFNNNPNVDGILVQLPVPKDISERKICQAVRPLKDVDGFHVNNIGKLSLNNKGIIPATALGVKELIVRSNIPYFGKNAVVIGRSKHVGFPIALLLHSDGKSETPGLDMTTTICHRYTPKTELESYTKLADIIISSVGIPGLVTADMVKPGACVIDVGITRVATKDGKSKLVGDVDFDAVKKIAGYITPVPGGVGPMTVAMLMKNTLIAAHLNENKEWEQLKSLNFEKYN